MNRSILTGLTIVMSVACLPGEDIRSQSLQDLARKLHSDSMKTRSAASKALAARSPEIEPVLEDLATALRDEYWVIRHSASEALARAGAKAVPTLIETLGREDYYSRIYAAKTLLRIGKPAREAIPALGEALEYGGIDVCRTSAEAIRVIGGSGRVVEQLLAAMEHPNRGVREAVVSALTPVGDSVASELTRLLEHPDRGVRDSAATALGNIGPRAAVGAEQLAKLLRGEADAAWKAHGNQDNVAIRYTSLRNRIRQSAVVAGLQSIGQPAVSPIAAMIDSNHPGRTRFAVHTLLGMNKANLQPAVAGCVEVWGAMQNDDWQWGSLKTDLCSVLAAAGPDAAPASALAVNAFVSQPGSRAHTARVLTAIGKPAVPLLREALEESPQPDIRKAINQLIQQIEP